MAPKKRNTAPKAPKQCKNAEAKRSPSNKTKHHDGQDGARKRAKHSNSNYLRKALDDAMTSEDGGSYAAGGLTFVAVSAAKSLTGAEQATDPLNLSQNFGQHSTSSDPLNLSSNNNRKSQQSVSEQNGTGSVAGIGSVDDITNLAAEPVVENQNRKLPSRRRNLVVEFATTASTTDPLEGTSQTKRDIPKDVPPPQKYDMPSDDSSDEWEPCHPGLLTKKFRTAGDKLSTELSTDDERDDEQHSAESSPKPAPVAPVTDGQQRTPGSHSPEQNPREADVEAEDDGDSYRQKYVKLLKAHKRKCKEIKILTKKTEEQEQTIAELKDLVVFANIETKKAQSDPDAEMIFTTNPEIAMTVKQLEEVNARSHSDITFGQNLAMFFYGAQTLQTMSVSGMATNRFKNAKASPGITPKKLAFIHEKVQQRVASRIGANNLAQINTLAHPTRINQGIAQKIANLKKATRYAEARKAFEQANSTASDPAK